MVKNDTVPHAGVDSRVDTHVRQAYLGRLNGYPFEWIGGSVWTARTAKTEATRYKTRAAMLMSSAVNSFFTPFYALGKRIGLISFVDVSQYIFVAAIWAHFSKKGAFCVYI